MALVEVKEDVWLQSDLILGVERNTTTGSVQVTYLLGSSIAVATITGAKTKDVVEKIQPTKKVT